MRINVKTSACLIAVPISLIGVAIGITATNYFIIWISILLLYVSLVFYVLKNRDTTIVFAGFLITFFTFLMGKYGIQTLMGEIEPVFDNAIFAEESMYIYISLLSLFVGYGMFRKRRKLTAGTFDDDNLTNYIKATREIGVYSRYLFYICIAFSIVVNIDIASRTFGNIYSLAAINSRMPFVIQKIAQMSGMLYWIFLSTLPNSKKAKIPTILFSINAILTLFSGVRGTAIRYIMAVALYYFFRHKNRGQLQDDSVWITKGMRIVSVVAIPVLIVFLGLFANVRLGEGLQFNGLFKGILLFFDQQGGSADLIGRALYCKNRNMLPSTNSSYTLGPIINLIREGVIGKLLGMDSFASGGQTTLLATHGNNLGATITYLMEPLYYNAGGGFGTCYIAELAIDAGIVGVIAFNIFLGWLLNNINYFMSRKWWMNALGLLIIKDVLYMPRDFALSFISSIFSVTNLLPLILLAIIGNQINSKRLIRGDDKL